jgi:predicted phage tail protein
MKKLISVVALFALVVSTLGLTVSWRAGDPAEQITGYRVYMAQGQSPFEFVGTATNGTSYTITNINPGVYRFYVTALNVWNEESDPSATAITPPPPSGVQAKAVYVVVGSKTNAIINLQ